MPLKPSDQTAHHQYFDHELQCSIVKVLPGEFFVSNGDLAIATVLGSCVAACIRDRSSRIGGMNHFMLPSAGKNQADDASFSMRYGACAMEVLINELLKSGADRRRLEAKVFGGAHVIAGARHLNVGERNARFVLKYLETEKIPVLTRDLNADWGRKVVYFPATGKVLVRKVVMTPQMNEVHAERAYASSIVETTTRGGEVDLF